MMNYQKKNMLLLGIKSALIYKKNLIASLFLDSDPVYNKNNLNAKIKPHGDEVTDIYDKKNSDSSLQSYFFSHTVISLDTVFKKDDNYPKMFLKESKYIEKKVIRHISDNLSDFSYFSDEFDEE